eukprot:6491011-Amphidinium_carterae.1
MLGNRTASTTATELQRLDYSISNRSASTTCSATLIRHTSQQQNCNVRLLHTNQDDHLFRSRGVKYEGVRSYGRPESCYGRALAIDSNTWARAHLQIDPRTKALILSPKWKDPNSQCPRIWAGMEAHTVFKNPGTFKPNALCMLQEHTDVQAPCGSMFHLTWSGCVKGDQPRRRGTIGLNVGFCVGCIGVTYASGFWLLMSPAANPGTKAIRKHLCAC